MEGGGGATVPIRFENRNATTRTRQHTNLGGGIDGLGVREKRGEIGEFGHVGEGGRRSERGEEVKVGQRTNWWCAVKWPKGGTQMFCRRNRGNSKQNLGQCNW